MVLLPAPIYDRSHHGDIHAKSSVKLMSITRSITSLHPVEQLKNKQVTNNTVDLPRISLHLRLCRALHIADATWRATMKPLPVLYLES